MRFKLSQKTIPHLRKFHELIASQVPQFNGLNVEGSDVYICLTVEPNQNLIDQIEAIVPPVAVTTNEAVQKIISDAIVFGNKMISEFAAENVIMGITQDNMTGVVRKRMSEVISALNTGSLYDAIAETKAIPSEHKDPKYITDARLLSFVNKIETYLGIPLSSSL